MDVHALEHLPGLLVAFIDVAANMASVLAFMYFGYLPRNRGANTNVLSFVSSDETSTLIRDADNPEDLFENCIASKKRSQT